MGRRIPATLLVATPSTLLQRGLADIVDELPEVVLVGRCQDALGTFRQMQALRPDLMILDPAFAQELKDLSAAGGHRPRILLLSQRHHTGPAPPCGRGCACGFVRDRASAEHVRMLLRVLAHCDRGVDRSPHCQRCPAQTSLSPPRLPLSERETQVFERIGRGQGSSAIAAQLGVSVKTVETYRESIKRKLGLESGHELLRAALLWHLGDFVPEEAALPCPPRL